MLSTKSQSVPFSFKKKEKLLQPEEEEEQQQRILYIYFYQSSDNVFNLGMLFRLMHIFTDRHKCLMRY